MDKEINMDAETFKELQKKAKMKCREIAAALGVVERTVMVWRKDGCPSRWDRLIRIVAKPKGGWK